MLSRKNLFTKYFLILICCFTNFCFPSFANDSSIDSKKPTSEYIKKRPKNNFYILGPGDVVSVEIGVNTSDLNGIYSIDGKGEINLPRLDNIYVSGLTVEELRNILNEEYSQYVIDPLVKINVVEYRPLKLYIDGEINSAGMYVLPGTINIINGKPNKVGKNFYFTSLVDLIRESGGITINSNLKKVKITRINNISDGGGRIGTEVNLLDVINLKDNSQNIRLFDGDNVFIPRSEEKVTQQISKAMKTNINPKYIKIMLSGEIENPGLLTVKKLTALNDVIDISGGKSPLTGKIHLIRYEANGEIKKEFISYRKTASRGTSNNPYLRDGDILVIKQGKLKETNLIVKTVTEPLVNIITPLIFLKNVADL